MLAEPKRRKSRLTGLVKRLQALYGPPLPPPTTDPYRLLLWDQVAYLAPEARRLEAYRLLERTVGTRPAEILAASSRALQTVTRTGGSVAYVQRAERLRQVATRVQEVWQGSLDRAVKRPLAEARRELARYPSVGESGADRILLLSGAHAVLGLDSNALRVLVRLGYGAERKQWAQTYREAQGAADRELPRRLAARRSAFLLLRQHGQELCQRSAPRCLQCPLREDCPTGAGRSA